LEIDVLSYEALVVVDTGLGEDDTDELGAAARRVVGERGLVHGVAVYGRERAEARGRGDVSGAPRGERGGDARAAAAGERTAADTGRDRGDGGRPDPDRALAAARGALARGRAGRARRGAP